MDCAFRLTSENVSTTFFVFFLLAFSSHSLNFQFSRSSPDTKTIILLQGDAEINSGGVIELIKVQYLYRVGRVIYNRKVPLWDPDSGKVADFTTHFSFTIDTLNKSTYGDGFSFFLAPVGFQIPPNSAEGFLGLFNTTTALSAEQIVTVEFDTVPNHAWDPSYPHVGINNRSVVSLVTTPWNASLHSGDVADTWITYNATARNLTVFWSYGGGPNSSLDCQIDLKQALPPWVTVGFSASTGLWVQQNSLRSWEFSSSLDIKDDINGNNRKNAGLVVGLTLSGCVLVACAIAAFIVWRKRRESAQHINIPTDAAYLTSIDEDLERGAGPRRFSYKDLALATNNFSAARKLGEGGFGQVYKGHLLDLDLPIAVKRFSRGSKQGKREYITEVKIISMLRHRNLVRLIGWCHDEGEFLLVYEFMPNGSLDHHLFGRKNTLDWTLRYKIALGLASSLLYLHEEWEQCVIHRDIKSSNVMLDSNFNVKLGDFGLARLMDHGLDPQTTGLAGTFGYMAPEYLTTRRASKESDVYSFGVVALEIATGRKSVEPMDEQSVKVLVEWIWDLYGRGQHLSAVDKRLKMEFVPEQVECLMIVGLWCAHPDSSLRPSMRQAIHVLNFEADLPQLASRMPIPLYHASQGLSSSGGETSSISSSMYMGR